jgi:hypothetical protein
MSRPPRPGRQRSASRYRRTLSAQEQTDLTKQLTQRGPPAFMIEKQPRIGHIVDGDTLPGRITTEDRAPQPSYRSAARTTTPSAICR